ncbi:MAG: hypothetical protein AAF689_11595 [Pseudomonadota bacterium]
MSADRMIVKLEDLLSLQASSLRNGELKRASEIVPAIELLIEKIEKVPGSMSAHRAAIKSLKARVDRNSGLISAARRGLEAAKTLVAPGPDDGFRAYDAQGRATQIGGAPGPQHSP